MLNWLLMPDSLWGASHGRSVPSLGVFLSLYLRPPFFPRPPPLPFLMVFGTRFLCGLAPFPTQMKNIFQLEFKPGCHTKEMQTAGGRTPDCLLSGQASPTPPHPHLRFCRLQPGHLQAAAGDLRQLDRSICSCSLCQRTAGAAIECL